MALKPAADGPNSLGPGSATSRSPWWGPLPSPSSHSGRSEAPENSETSPREKGNLGLPVLLTDGSTHLEQIVGSERGPLSCRNAARVESGAQRPEDAQECEGTGGGVDRGSEGRGAKVTGADELLSGSTGASRVTPPRRCSLCGDRLQQLEFGGWGETEVNSLLCASSCFFFQADGTRGKHGCVGGMGAGEGRGRGAHQRVKKRTPAFTHNLLRHVDMWKVRCTWITIAAIILPL